MGFPSLTPRGKLAGALALLLRRCEISLDDRRRQYSALTISAVVHALLLGLLALWVIHVPGGDAPVSTQVDFRRSADVDVLEVATTVSTAAAASVSSSAPPSERLIPLDHSPEARPFELQAEEGALMAAVGTGHGIPLTAVIPPDPRQHRPPGEKQKETRVEAETELAGVAGHVLGSLRGGTAQGPTLAVWLLDQSLSMQEQHTLMADRLEEELVALHQSFADDPGRLMHVGVAFGIGTYEFLEPTSKPYMLMNAMKEKVSVDPTGVENVFTAVQRCVQQYKVNKRAFRSRNLVVIIMTDESGDDGRLLEQTIQLCNKHDVRVDVVGPSAVLGRQKGFHRYVHPFNGVTYYLPVDRGPDCGFPQRTSLPYWHRGVPFDWDEEERGPWQGALPAWMGGTNHESILSGFSPYALTRLTRETGGQYTIFDRPGDRSPFELNRMRAYMPDYRSLKEINEDLRQEEAALRRAVLAAVQLGGPGPPAMHYGVGRLGGVSYYNWISPQAFQSSGELAAMLRQSENASRQIDLALRTFGDDGLEEVYEQEFSPRWRAWYDLTRGRLLAASVRHAEFQLLARQLTARGGINPATNGLVIGPSSELSPSRVSRSRAAEAERLLKRCVEENYETPWRYLAERELAFPLGLSVQQLSIPRPPIPPPAPAVPFVPRPQVTLPRL